jgi:hypothetical protein
MATSTKKSQPSSKQTAQYADGGQPGLQPAMAIAYADGGSLDQGGRGPWGGDLNASTTTFNQDYLRGASFGNSSDAGLIVPPPVQAPDSGVVGDGSVGFNPQFGGLVNGQPVNETNPDGSVNLGTQGARIGKDMTSDAAKGAGKFAVGMVAPGLAKPLNTAMNAYDAYTAYNENRPLDAAMSLTTIANPVLGALGKGGLEGYRSYSLGDHLNPDQNFAQNTLQGYNIRSSDDQIGSLIGAIDSRDSTANAPAMQQAFRAAEIGQMNQVDGRSAGLTAQANAMPGDALGNLMGLTNSFGTGSGGTRSSSLGSGSLGNTQSSYGAAMGSMTGGGGGGSGGSSSSGGGNSNRGESGASSARGFADGGMPGAPAAPMPPTAPPPGPPGLQMPSQAQAPGSSDPMHPALANLHVQNKLSNPQVMAQLKQHLQQAIQAGRVSPQQLQMMGQLAQSAIQHPELWPKLRQFAIQAGMPDAKNLPMQFDQSIAMALMTASQVAQHGDRPGAFADGGMLHGPGSGTSDSIHAQNTSTGQPVKLSNHEYIIPADVVATKGKEFFDNLVRKYHTPAALQR